MPKIATNFEQNAAKVEETKSAPKFKVDYTNWAANFEEHMRRDRDQHRSNTMSEEGSGRCNRSWHLGWRKELKHQQTKQERRGSDAKNLQNDKIKCWEDSKALYLTRTKQTDSWDDQSSVRGLKYKYGQPTMSKHGYVQMQGAS